jgi:hypothetical protein
VLICIMCFARFSLLVLLPTLVFEFLFLLLVLERHPMMGMLFAESIEWFIL